MSNYTFGHDMEEGLLTLINRRVTNPIINYLIIGLDDMTKFRTKLCIQCNNEYQCINGHNDSYCSTPCRFWSKVNIIEGENSCWLWKPNVTKGGYGNIVNGGQSRVAHRYSYELNIGPIPFGMLVCHKCDVRHCVRPDHLFLGTAKDNALDCAIKNRTNKSILTNEMVVDILADTRTNKVIAADYGVNSTTICNIKNNNIWKHIEGERTPIGTLKGELNPAAKLDSEQVIAIRKDPRKLLFIAQEYGISESVVSSIKNGKTWKHISGELDPRPDKGRFKKGQITLNSKLTEEQVISIRLEKRNNVQIAKDYGVTRECIREIKNGKTWSHIKSEIYVRDKYTESGENHRRCKYKNDMVLAIRASTKSRKELALEYGVSESVIKNLKSNHNRLAIKEKKTSMEKGGIKLGGYQTVDINLVDIQVKDGEVNGPKKL